ncbi:MAG: hypothetical protein ACHQK8_06825 [Bacteroidia bacterium]
MIRISVISLKFISLKMKAASISEIKKELRTLELSKLLELCMRLAKYKKDNKELITYLLFEADDEEKFIKGIKEEMDIQFDLINKSNIYYAKKSVRKILRTTNKFIRYSGSGQTAAELLIYFCTKMRTSKIPFHTSAALNNLFEAQVKKINKVLETMHEDLQYDYRKELDKISG